MLKKRQLRSLDFIAKMSQSKLQERLQKLREEKDVLRLVKFELQHLPPVVTTQETQSDCGPSQAASSSCQTKQTSTTSKAPAPKSGFGPRSNCSRMSPKVVTNVSCAAINVPPPSSNMLHIDLHSDGNQSTHDTSTVRKSSSQLVDLMGSVGYQPLREIYDPEETSQVSYTDDDFVRPQSSVQGAPLKFQFTLCDEVTSASRYVSAIKFHSKFDNVMLTAHSERYDGRLDVPQGTVGIWAMDRPQASLQRTLIAPAPLTTLELFPISPTVVIGGTSIGSVHLWDLRVKSALSVSAFDQHAVDISDCHGRRGVTRIQTTAMSSPFFITTSASGHVCKWSLSQTDGPLSQSVAHDPVISDKMLIRAMDFPRSTRLSADEKKGSNRSPSLFVGTSQGTVCRLEADGRLWNAALERGYHDAPVTAVHAHPSGMRVPQLDDVIATSSYDWSVNLWYFRRGQTCKKLWSYDNMSNGVVHDVAWSTIHPSVLCWGDEAGVLSLFDLSGHLQNSNTGSASWKFVPTKSTESCAISTIQWSSNDRFICTGDTQGRISVWSTTSYMASLPDSEWMAQFLKSKANRI